MLLAIDAGNTPAPAPFRAVMDRENDIGIAGINGE